MKRIITILLVVLSFSSCNKDQKPKEFIDRSKYKEIMEEIILANLVNNEKKVKDSLHFNTLELVYKKFGIDSLTLKINSDYYAKYPELLEEIYKEIKADFKVKYDSVTKIDSIRRLTRKKSPKKVDSISIPKEVLGIGLGK